MKHYLVSVLEHYVPCRAESRTAATQKARSKRDTRGTPEVYITPLAEQKVVRLPRKSRGAKARQNKVQRCRIHDAPEGHQRSLSRPLQSRKLRAYHAK